MKRARPFHRGEYSLLRALAVLAHGQAEKYFFEARVPGKNDSNFFRRCGGKNLRCF